MPTDHGEVELDDVRVPADAILGDVDRGLEVGQTFLHENRIRQAASSLGAAQYCIDRAVAYAKQRMVFGKPLAVNQAVQWPLVELQTEAQMVRLLVYYAAWHLDRNHHMEVSDKVSMANYRANRLVCEAADRAMQVFGGIGYSRHEPFEHIYRHHRRYRITEGAEEIQIRRVAQRLFGFGRKRDMTDELAAALAKVLSPVLGDDVVIENLRPLTGGASRTTWAFDAVTDGAGRALILRTGPPDDVHAGMELEARVQALAAEAGAPVPHILVADNSPAALGNPFLVCDEIGGETIARKIHRALDEPGRQRLLQQCAHALAAIHRANPYAVGLTQEDQLAEWRARLDEMGDTTATFEWAFRWLAGHRPPSSPSRLVHGDFRMGNLIVDGSNLAAVLDWELVHIGEPHEDLAWFCIRAWRFGAPERWAPAGWAASKLPFRL